MTVEIKGKRPNTIISDDRNSHFADIPELLVIPEDNIKTDVKVDKNSEESVNECLTKEYIKLMTKLYRNGQVEDGKERQCCNCKKTKCLKMYCSCFATGQFCEGCRCLDCLNLKQYTKEREKAYVRIVQNNPDALDRRLDMMKYNNKIAKSINTGTRCNCAKSECTMEYCRCFSLGVKCGAECKCKGCHNREVFLQ